MAGDLPDDVVMRLAFRGMDPAEIERLASMQGSQLAAAMKIQEAKLRALHQQAQQTRTQDELAEVQKRIKAEQDYGRTMQTVAKEVEKAGNAGRASWRRLLEDMENVSTIAMAGMTAVQAVMGTLSWFKRLGEEIISTTQIHGAFKGSVEDLSQALGGEVRALDIVTAKNRAMMSELDLSDADFKTIAQSAKAFGDAVGTDTKQGMEALIGALVTGRTRTFAQMGVMIDASAASERFALSVGKTADKLSDTEKKTALQNEALHQMRLKFKDAGDAGGDFASTLEGTFARTADAWDHMIRRMGESKGAGAAASFILDSLSALDENNVSIALAAITRQDTSRFRPGATAEDVLADRAYAANREFMARMKELQKAVREENRRKKEVLPGMMYGPAVPSWQEWKRMKKGDPAAAERAREAARARVGELDYLMAEAIAPLDLTEFDEYGPAMPTPEQWEAMQRESARQAEEEKKRGIRTRKVSKVQGTLRRLGVDPDAIKTETEEELLPALEETLRATNEKLSDKVHRLGGENGFMNQLLFGYAGSQEKFIEMVSRIPDQLAGPLGLVGELAEGMSDAIAKSIAAAAFGADEKQSFEARTKALLQQLSTQAIGHAMMEGALSLASFAGGDARGFATHAAASGAFTGLAVWAGAASKLLDADPAKGKESKSAAQSRSNFSEARGTGDRGKSEAAPIYNINMTVFPGGEAMAGERVREALSADFRKNQRRPEGYG